MSEYEKTYWKEKFSSARDAYDLYVLFIEQGLRLVREGGTCGLIVPNKYLAAPFAKSLREYLIENHTILRLRDVSRVRVFDDASVYPVISILQRGQSAKSYPILVEQVTSYQEKTYVHSSDLLKSFPDYIWGFLLSERTELIQKLGQVSERLGSESVSKVNASSTAGEADSYGPHIEEWNTHTEHSWKIVNTGTIERFFTQWGHQKLTHQGERYLRPVLPKHAPVVSQNRSEQYSTPKLIFAKMALRIEAFIDHEGKYASMNTNFALERPNNVSVWFLGAVCNSRLLSWVYDQYFNALRMGGGYYQFQAPQLKVLPVRRISFATPSEVRERLRQDVQDLYTRFRTDGDYRPLLDFASQYLARAPAGNFDEPDQDSDVVHDLLVYLAEQMMELNIQRLAAVEDFVLSLEGELSATDLQSINRLWTPPRAPDQDDSNFEYRQARFTETMLEAEQHLGQLTSRIVELRKDIGQINENQWKWLLRRRLGRISNLADLVRVYRTRQPAIAKLDSHIGHTDYLIDQVVYKLYGLSEEEITIVESGGSDLPAV